MTKKEETITEDKTLEVPLEVRQAKLEAELEADKRQRVAQCQAAIQQAIEQYDCTIDAYTISRQGSVTAHIEIRAK